MNNKTTIPLILALLSFIVFMSPEILGMFTKKGITLSESESIAWAVIMFGSAGTGFAHGFYIVRKRLSFFRKALT